jgi:secreted protein with Ig-like and vWFA domain
MNYDKNDPTLTAYALGELSPEEAKVVQESIQGDAAIQTEVEALRNLADDLTQTLAAEPLPSGGPIPLDHAELVEATSDSPSPTASTETTSGGPGFRRILLLVASVVIICGVGLLLSPGGREYIAGIAPEADQAAKTTSDQASAELPMDDADMDGEDVWADEEIDFSGLESETFDEPNTSWNASLPINPVTENLEAEARRESGVHALEAPAGMEPDGVIAAPSTPSPERPRENEESEGRDYEYNVPMSGEGGMGGGYSGGWDRESVSGRTTNNRGYGEGETGSGMGGGMGGMGVQGMGEVTPGRNSFDTGWIDSRATDGFRYEIGDTEGHQGQAMGDNPTHADPSAQLGSITGSRAPQEESTPSNPGESAGYMPTTPTESVLQGSGTGPEAPNGSGNGLALATRPEGPRAVGMSAPGVLATELNVPTDPSVDAFASGTSESLADPSDGRPQGGLMESMDWFAPPADDSYAGGSHPREGFFATAEYARMSLAERDRYEYESRLPELGLPRVRGEVYFDVEENQFQLPAEEEQRFSTFSIDVDTGSYANVRRFVMQQGVVPPPSAVRIEEMVNYFSYDYEQPEDDVPFATHVEVGPCPWAPDHRLAKIGLKGVEMDANERPPLNLVFLLDVSGSMSSSKKLPLVKQGMTMLAETLRRKDHVAIVTYAGNAKTVLPPTSGRDMGTIMDAINQLSSGGSTAGAAGIQQAYDVVQENYDPEAVNRIILCTDGDFNVGVSRFEDLLQIVEEKTDETGAFITILGFGMGNLKEGQLEQLADSGDGNYGYVDNEDEAHKLLVEELSGTLIPIAKNVKIQIDFNPANVQAYRLIGYENRALATEDFYNDAVDAGEIGAGHTVTAIYEIIPPGVEIPTPDVPRVDPSRYDDPIPATAEPADEVEEEGGVEAVDGFAPSEFENELFFLKLRYMEVDGDEGIDLAFPVEDPGINVQTSKDFEFASSVALCGMLLRGSDYAGDGSFATVLELALSGKGEDDRGYRSEFIEIVQRLAPAEATIEATAEESPEE